MNFIHDRYWLEFTLDHIARVLAKLLTDLFFVLLPSVTLTTKAIDTKRVVVVEVLEHLLWTLWRCDGAGSDRDKFVELVSKEFLLEV